MPRNREARRSGSPRGTIRVGREVNLKRSSGTKEQRRVLLVGTNGKVAEYQYLRRLHDEEWANCRIHAFFSDGSPEQLVAAVSRRMVEEDYDNGWAVCDRDTFDVATAVRNALSCGVELVLSVPCFEVWLVLHFADCRAHLEDAQRATRRLQSHLPTWDKSRLRFDDFQPGILDAARRARELDEPPTGNPSTAMWKLIDAIQG